MCPTRCSLSGASRRTLLCSHSRAAAAAAAAAAASDAQHAQHHHVCGLRAVMSVAKYPIGATLWHDGQKHDRARLRGATSCVTISRRYVRDRDAVPTQQTRGGPSVSELVHMSHGTGTQAHVTHTLPTTIFRRDMVTRGSHDPTESPVSLTLQEVGRDGGIKQP